MVDTNPTISTITLNVNGLSTPIKRQRCRHRLKKKDTTVSCLHETLYYEDTDILKTKEWKKMYYANTNQKKIGLAILKTK